MRGKQCKHIITVQVNKYTQFTRLLRFAYTVPTAGNNDLIYWDNISFIDRHNAVELVIDISDFETLPVLKEI